MSRNLSNQPGAAHAAGAVSRLYDVGVRHEPRSHLSIFSEPEHPGLRRACTHRYSYAHCGELTAAMVSFFAGKLCALSSVQLVKRSTLHLRPCRDIWRARTGPSDAILSIDYQQKIAVKNNELNKNKA